MKKRQFVAGAVLMSLVLGAGLLACSTTSKPAAQPVQAQTEAFEKFHAIVDADFVKQHIAVPMPENVMVIDSRPKRAKYDNGHIPMAVSIPDTYFNKMVDQLPKDKNALLVFYCGGLKCPLSHKSAFKAEALGYTNVKVFAEGFPGWMKAKGNYAAVSVEWVAKQLEENTGMVLVDSRPKQAKYDKGHIPGAISIPDTYFDKMTAKLPQEKDTPLVFYCGGLKCPLSHKSATKAIALGYTNVKVFADGFPAYLAYAGSDKVAKAAPKIKAGKEEGSIDKDTFTELVKDNPGSIYIIDVRDPAEFDTGSFKTAINIPVDQLADRIDSLPSDKPIVFVCGTGARSGESYYMVQDLRPELKEVYYVEAQITFNKDGSFVLSEITAN